MKLEYVKLRGVKHGDTWVGLGSISVMKDLAGDEGAQASLGVDLTDCTIEMQLRLRPKHGSVAASWSTADGSITIPDPAGGVLKVHDRIIDLKPATYYWSIQITFPATAPFYANRVLTIAQGTLPVFPNPTRG